MGEQNLYSEEQLERLQAKLADVKQELQKEEKTAIPDIGDNSTLRVSEDGMTAWLCLSIPPEDSKGYEVKNIIAYLKNQGIVYGCDEEIIHKMVENEQYGLETVIASGKEMIEGKDGFFEYKFPFEESHAPKILPDGSVDYTSMHRLENVRAGDILAVYHHAEQGEEGYTIYGIPIKPAVAKELRPIRGRNISNQEDPDTYVSLVAGKVELKDGRLDIQSIHEIQGDVDLIIGKVEFFGDIVISGNVEAGVLLRAGRNIIIKGTAEAVTMFAGGDITLERGIQGGQKGKLSARGNIMADFIEHCQVEAGGNIQANAIMNSHVSAAGTVTLTGKRGRIIGGYTHGMKGVTAVSLGNMSEIKTIVHAGFEAQTYEDLVRLSREEVEVSDQIRSVLEEMANIMHSRKQQNGGVGLKSVEARLPALNQRKDELFAKMDKLKSDIESAKEQIEKGKGSKIDVNGTIYRGVIICVENHQLPLTKENSFTSYQVVSNMIQESVLVYK